MSLMGVGLVTSVENQLKTALDFQRIGLDLFPLPNENTKAN